MSNYDPVNKPEHYANTKVECIDAMEEVFGKEAMIPHSRHTKAFAKTVTVD